MIRTCIIGVSGYGRVHYELMLDAHRTGLVAPVGATIINPAEEAEKCAALEALGCRIFADYTEMLHALSGHADLCMIPTGTPLHRPMTIAALEAGMHVLVEKPLAGSLEDAQAMQRAAARAGKVVAVGYQHMYSDAAIATKRDILDGRIGDITSMSCLVTWPRAHDYYRRNGWAGTLRANGVAVNDTPFNNAVAHDLMMMLFQAGPTERTAARPDIVSAQLYRANEIESADTACIEIITENQIPVRFYATHACQNTFGPEIHIRGTKGSICMTHSGATVAPDEGPRVHRTAEAGQGGREVMMAAVLSAIRGGASFICDLEMAACQTMVVSKIHQACSIQAVKGEIMAADDGSLITCIPGIEEALRRASQEERLLQKNEVPTQGKEVTG